MITLSEGVSAEFTGLRWIFDCEGGTNSDFHDEYFVTRDIAGPVYSKIRT
jgi:hypothetical protein